MRSRSHLHSYWLGVICPYRIASPPKKNPCLSYPHPAIPLYPIRAYPIHIHTHSIIHLSDAMAMDAIPVA